MLVTADCPTSKTVDQHALRLEMPNAPYVFLLLFSGYWSGFGYAAPTDGGAAMGLSSSRSSQRGLSARPDRSCLLLRGGPEGKSRDSPRSFRYPAECRRRRSSLGSSSCGSMSGGVFVASSKNYWFEMPVGTMTAG